MHRVSCKDRLRRDSCYYYKYITHVDTGAYITSFSYGVGAGRPRGKSSEGRPKGTDQSTMADRRS